MIVQILAFMLAMNPAGAEDLSSKFTADGVPKIFCTDGPSLVRNGCTTGANFCEFPRVDCHVLDILNFPKGDREAVGQMRIICRLKDGKCPTSATDCANEHNTGKWIKAAVGDDSYNVNTWINDDEKPRTTK